MCVFIIKKHKNKDESMKISSYCYELQCLPCCQLSSNLSFPSSHIDKCYPEFHMEWGSEDDFVFRFLIK